MKRKLKLENLLLPCIMCCSALLSGKLFAFEEYDKDDYMNQLYSEVVSLDVGSDEEGRIIYYKTQQSNNEYLYLGPNEVFFTPNGILTTGGEKANNNFPLNQNKEFNFIKGLRNVGEAIEWGFITSTTGDVKADFFIAGKSPDVGATFLVQIDDGPKSEVVITEEMLEKGSFTVDFMEFDEGFHVFKVTVVKKASVNDFKIFNVRLSGEGVLDSYVARERWRPTAVYSRWHSSENRKNVKAWIMEVSSESELGHFSPITTKFGYFGPVFEPGGTAVDMNMSIWSSGGTSDPLPVDEQSHLLGIGSNQGIFSGWSHEGRGVKVRNWKNFESNTSKKYVVGLRFENDGDFTTFYGYFWDEVTNKWQLYSVGRQLAKKNLKVLRTEGFIEVPGVASKQRTNHQERKVIYRGWVRDSEGVWSDLDQLDIPKGTGLTNHKRGVLDDGEYFFASTGGLDNRQKPEVSSVLEKEKITNLPRYMSKRKLRAFDRVPFIPRIEKVVVDEQDGMGVSFRVMTPHESKVTLVWGENNANTLEDEWENSETFDIPAGRKKKVHSVVVPASKNVRYLRILVRDTRAQMWSFNTFVLEQEE